MIVETGENKSLKRHEQHTVCGNQSTVIQPFNAVEILLDGSFQLKLFEKKKKLFLIFLYFSNKIISENFYLFYHHFSRITCYGIIQNFFFLVHTNQQNASNGTTDNVNFRKTLYKVSKLSKKKKKITFKRFCAFDKTIQPAKTFIHNTVRICIRLCIHACMRACVLACIRLQLSLTLRLRQTKDCFIWIFASIFVQPLKILTLRTFRPHLGNIN